MSFSSIPLSSQSAPIDEYIVLWTADKYKKLKKWHDGYLRYHTFNKRLMVYDHLMNKVCDKFLPEPEPIEIGDELVLDSHLVTIEDVKGRQAQDLRPLFEKTVDRRRERSSTATPMRPTWATAGPGQSPTPTLLRTIQSRPSTGKAQPVYPSPVPRHIPTESPEPATLVPQKRKPQVPTVVQKISYPPFNVPKLRPDNEPTPLFETSTKRFKGQQGRSRNRVADVESPPKLVSPAECFQEDDDGIEILELEFEEADFAPKPKSDPPPRARPNVPPPFKPPKPQPSAQRTANLSSPVAEKSISTLPITRDLIPTSQPVDAVASSPRIPPSTTTNPTQEPLSSPTIRKRPTINYHQAQVAQQVHSSSPAKSPSPILAPQSEPLSEEEEPEPPARLALPSAASRTRRKLLCGPSSRPADISNKQPPSRPVSTLSILDTFPTDDPTVANEIRRKKISKAIPKRDASNKTTKPSSKELSAANPVIKSKLSHALAKPFSLGRPALRDLNGIGPSAPALPVDKLPPVPRSNAPQSNIKDDSNLNPISSNEEDLGPLNSEASKSKNDDESLLNIFSSDNEDLAELHSKRNHQKPKPPPTLDIESSSDEFEALRSSALPKHLVKQSRNVKTLGRQHVSEASRVWKDSEN